MARKRHNAGYLRGTEIIPVLKDKTILLIHNFVPGGLNFKKRKYSPLVKEENKIQLKGSMQKGAFSKNGLLRFLYFIAVNKSSFE